MAIRIILLAVFLVSFPVKASALDANEAFHRISTVTITSSKKGTDGGTAFFYQQLGPANPEIKGPQWRSVKKTWLVTNRHVVLPRMYKTASEYDEILPDSFSFHMRKLRGNSLEWDPITLSRSELIQRARFHIDSKVDVAVIEIQDLLLDRMKRGKYVPWYPLSKEDFPSNKKISVGVSDDIVIVGYPRLYYDTVNLYPIVKTGIIASRWGAKFQGKSSFLIDAKLFPGSSGSIVVTKPKNIDIIDGSLAYSKEKVFALLGIFSGEPFEEGRKTELENMTIIEKLGYNVGIVWYADLIEEIIESGAPHTVSPAEQKK